MKVGELSPSQLRSRREYYAWLAEFEDSDDAYDKPWLSPVTVGECMGSQSLGDAAWGGAVSGRRKRQAAYVRGRRQQAKQDAEAAEETRREWLEAVVEGEDVVARWNRRFLGI